MELALRVEVGHQVFDVSLETPSRKGPGRTRDGWNVLLIGLPK